MSLGLRPTAPANVDWVTRNRPLAEVSQRLLRATWIVAAVGAVAAFVIVYSVTLSRWYSGGFLGWDAGHYFDAARRWVETGTPYLASEVAGRFVYGDLTFLHPPLGLYLITPFAYLPTILWWIVPIAGSAYFIVSMRPARWSWPLLIALLCWPTLAIATANGNTDLWVLFAVSAGLRLGWPALVVAAKPSMLPLIILGTKHRSWWVGLAILALVSIPFGALWLEWFAVVRNSPASLTYSLASMVPMLAPVLAHRFGQRP